MALFNKIHKIQKRHYSEMDKVEIIEFYQMLVKIKKNRPNFNIERLMRKVYPNLDIDFSCCSETKSMQ